MSRGPRNPTVRRTDLDRLIAAFRAAEIPVTGARVDPGGAVTLLTAGEMPAQDSAPTSALDAWREKRNGARAA